MLNSSLHFFPRCSLLLLHAELVLAFLPPLQPAATPCCTRRCISPPLAACRYPMLNDDQEDGQSPPHSHPAGPNPPIPYPPDPCAACCYSMLNDEEDGLEALNAAMASGACRVAQQQQQQPVHAPADASCGACGWGGAALAPAGSAAARKQTLLHSLAGKHVLPTSARRL